MPEDQRRKSLSEYKDKYVAFLDLLGFKAQVERAEQNDDERVNLHKILELVRDTIGGNPHIGLRLNYFSDCMVISANRTDKGLWEMFESVLTLAFNLLQYDVMVRGGLTAGGAHHGDYFVYGTAVSRAYLLECQLAKNPITLLSQEVVEDARRYGEDHNQRLLDDGPDRYFVDYLRYFADYRPNQIYSGKVVLDDPGRRVMDFICQRLNKDSGKIRKKAEWLQDYWNKTVAVHGVFGRIEAGVTERYRSQVPTIIHRRMWLGSGAREPRRAK